MEDRALVDSKRWCAQQGPEQRKGPHRAAMAEAARAAAAKPTQRVLFKAACRVEAPQRPGLDKPAPTILGRRAAPVKKEAPEVDVEVGAVPNAATAFLLLFSLLRWVFARFAVRVKRGFCLFTMPPQGPRFSIRLILFNFETQLYLCTACLCQFAHKVAAPSL